MDANTWRIQELEKQVDDLQKEVRYLRSIFDQGLGISTAAKWGIRILLVLAGTGGVSAIHWLVKWLSSPVK